MASKSTAHDEEGAAACLDGRDRANIETTFAQCFRNAITVPCAMMMEELREATWQLAEAMRADGARPERALIELKALLRNPRDRYWTPSLSEPVGRLRVEAQVYRRLFEWWLTAYFAQPPSRARTRNRTVAAPPQEPSEWLGRWRWNRQAYADAE
jgi:hypothetical protein